MRLAKSLPALAVLFAFLLICRTAHANVLVIDVGHPTKSGDEIVTVSFKIGNETKTLEAQTGKPGDPSDDIPKSGRDKEKAAADKAKRIAKAINEASKAFSEGGVSNPVTATAIQDTVSVATNSDAVKITGGNITMYTGERTKIVRVTSGGFAFSEWMVGTVDLLGRLSGITDDGAPATIVVGTNRYESILSTGDFQSVPALVRALAADLQAHGIRVTTNNGEQGLILLMHVDEDDILSFGTDDKTLDLQAGLVRF